MAKFSAALSSVVYRLRLAVSRFGKKARGARSAHPLEALGSLIVNRPSGYKSRVAGLFVEAAVSGRPLLEWVDAPTCRVLYVVQPWFGLNLKLLVEQAWAQGVLWVSWHPAKEGDLSGREAASECPGDDFRTRMYRGLNIWKICSYQIALEASALPEEVALHNSVHREVVVRLFRRAERLVDEAVVFFDYYQPTSVVYAQGYDLSSAVLRHLAVLRGVRTVALENIFRKDRLLWEDVSGISVNKTLAKNYYWRFADVIDPRVARVTVETYLASIMKMKSAEHASPLRALEMGDVEGLPVVLYIGQVMMDSSVLFGIRGFASQVEVIAELAGWASDKQVRVIVKLHPREGARTEEQSTYYRGVTRRRLEGHAGFVRAKASLGDRLVIDADNDFNTFDLVRRANACVTVTSQAGLEALALGKEVITCGSAFYSDLGFTHDVSSAESLRASLHEVVFDGRRRNVGDFASVFFHVYTELYCRPKSENGLIELARGGGAYPALISDPG